MRILGMGWAELIIVLIGIIVAVVLILEKKHKTQAQPIVYQQPAAQPSASADQIAELYDLVEKGVITREDFEAQKAKYLS